MRPPHPVALLFALLAQSLLSSAPACAQEADLTPQQVAVLRADSAMRHAYARSDKPLDVLMEYFVDDAHVLAPGVQLASGKQEVRAIFAGLHALPDFSLIWTPSSVEADKQLAYTIGTYHLEFGGQDGQRTEVDGKYLTVWRKQRDGSWRIAADTFNENGDTSAEGR
ncbi:MAG: DUF4440 domain-containing protein [Gemmatimonadales bacterium]|jgi:ketosteroid isomerase-like protein